MGDPYLADIVEADGMRKPGEEQTDHVTPRFERAGFFLHIGVAGQLAYQVGGNEIAELAEDGERGAGWRGTGLFFHPCLVAGKHHPRQLIFSSRRGMAVVGLVDSLAAFKVGLARGTPLEEPMPQVNHPNARGHEWVGCELVRWFQNKSQP
jgi:hypothetical protein